MCCQSRPGMSYPMGSRALPPSRKIALRAASASCAMSGPFQHSAKPPRRYIVRRLTPLECCRLQGFPDWWEDGANGSDSARYKMWGNGIALPCAADVMRRIAKAITEVVE